MRGGRPVVSVPRPLSCCSTGLAKLLCTFVLLAAGSKPHTSTPNLPVCLPTPCAGMRRLMWRARTPSPPPAPGTSATAATSWMSSSRSGRQRRTRTSAERGTQANCFTALSFFAAFVGRAAGVCQCHHPPSGRGSVSVRLWGTLQLQGKLTVCQNMPTLR